MMPITPEPFGQTPDGKPISLYSLYNKKGVCVKITNIGASIVSLLVPDQRGNPVDVVLGYPMGEDYLGNPTYFGSLVGRHANRIYPATVTIDGVDYDLIQNDGENNLHSGGQGTFNKFFSTSATGGNTLTLMRTIGHLEDGFPGTIHISVTYHLSEKNALSIRYSATSDANTIVNLTNHSYFNLSGHASGTIHDHLLKLSAPFYMVHDKTGIPTGEILSVEDTPYDFRSSTPLKDTLESDHPHIVNRHGLDNSFVLPHAGMGKIATLQSLQTGIKMHVHTDQSCVQLYSGSYLGDQPLGKDNTHYPPYSGICFETQHAPNTPHMPWLAPISLYAGDIYCTETIFQFETASL